MSEHTILVCLPFLGGSTQTWRGVADHLPPSIEVMPIDLPGFGNAAALPGHDVAAMADHVAALIRARRPARWMLAGHSMGGKVAAVLARRAEDGEDGLQNLVAAVLLAASPPTPEPMPERQRQAMLGWFRGDAAQSQAEAEGYVDANAVALPGNARALAVTGVLQMNPAAWADWLTGGSLEDWADRIGLLQTPALIAAGSEDGELGPDAQRSLVAPHWATVQLEVLPGAKHLLPLEQPAAVAALIASAATGIVPNRPALPPIGAAYRALIGSARVSARTRAALLDRAGPVSGAPAALPARAYAVLVAVLDRVVPQGEAPIDLAARIDAQLAAGTGDGWRFDALPPDLTAYTDALETLDDQGFLDMDGAGQDRLLQHAATGPLPMQRWFEELRGDAAKAYVAHPATMARLGYSGIAYGGDTDRLSGFQALGIGAREPWEPA